MKSLAIFSSLLLAFAFVGCSSPKPRAASGHPDVASPGPLRDAYWYYQLGRLDLAEPKIQTVLQTEPDNPAALHLLKLVREREYRRQVGAEPAWGYYQTFPQQPIYR